MDVGETIPAALVVELACKPEGDESVHPKGVQIRGATIIGELDFEDRTLTRPLWLSECTIADGINLRGARAKVLGFQDCPKIGGIEAGELRVDRSLLLRRSTVKGRVYLIGADIGGSLECSGSYLDGGDEPALRADMLKVAGAIFLRNGFRANGALVLDRAHVGALNDSPDCWPTQKGGLELNGFTYGALAAHCGLDSDSRLRWLHLQPKLNYFDPQPYEQLAKVMKAQGHNADARAVLIAKERDRRPFLQWHKRVLSVLFDVLVGYGYRPWLAAVWMAVFIAGGALAVAQADHLGHMVPAKERVYMDKAYVADRVLPAEYPHLQPVVYSLDVFLPFVDLQQEDYWMPTDQRGQARVFGRGMMLWRWLHIAFGWALSALFVAGITGLIKKE
ncbi:hypothetical protein A6A05_02515 [Magnetospirillum moscoviense]|uniref:Membrane-associated oxidoreductase n=1 Tax=Magnetospirillum moscoviense TaxID=1437059 RepID=A0A178ML56_9PROT|nr:hypothetical protein A6A05_02515 [Magnetospirillum moscoviense]